MKRWKSLIVIGCVLVLSGACSDDATTGDVSGGGSDASAQLDGDKDSSDSGPWQDGAGVDATARLDTLEDAEQTEPLSPIIEACTELFPPLCEKVISCTVGDALGELLGPLCGVLVDNGGDLLVAGCEALTDALPGDGFIDDLIAEILFPLIQECVEDFACTPENIAYFAGAFQDLFSALSGGGGGFDASSIGELMDLFTNCDEPPVIVDPDPEPDVLGDVVEEDAASDTDPGPDDVTDEDDATDVTEEDASGDEGDALTDASE